MKNLGQMMKQAQEMQTRMQELPSALERVEITGCAGGDMVRVTVNGKGEMRSLTVDESLVVPADKEVMEDLVGLFHHLTEVLHARSSPSVESISFSSSPGPSANPGS